MALSGSIATAAWRSQSGKDWKVVLNWTAEQNIEKNTSTVKWNLTMNTTQSGYVVTSELRVKFAGEEIYYRSYSNHTNAYNGTVLASGEKVITHNNDGSKSFTASVEAGIYNWAINKSGSGTIDLDDIPRASAVACSTVAIGQKPTISITRASSSFRHTLRYVFGSLSGTIVEKTSVVSYKDWTIPTSFYAQVPNAQYGTGTIYCDTYNGAELIGTKSCSFRANVTNSHPTFTVTLEEADEETAALTGDNQKVIRYFSDVRYTINATAKNGASIAKYQIINGSTKKSTASGTFTDVADGAFQVSVTDSRGFTTSQVYELDLIEYIKVTCNIWLKSVDVEGRAVFGVSGNFFNGSFGAQENTLTLFYEYKSGYEDYSGTIYEITPTIEGNEYEAEVTVEGLDYTKTYTFRCLAHDKMRSVYSVELPVRVLPVFDWGEEDFNFNVPIQMNGETVLRHNRGANNTVLSASGGFIYFRPGGTNTTSNEARLNPQGKLEIADILIDGKSLKSLLQGLGADI